MRPTGGICLAIFLVLNFIMDLTGNAIIDSTFAATNPTKRPRTRASQPSRSPEKRKLEKERASLRDSGRHGDTAVQQAIFNLLNDTCDAGASSTFPPRVSTLQEDPTVGRFLSAVNDALEEGVCCVCTELVCAVDLNIYDSLPNMHEMLQAPDGSYWLYDEGLTRDDDGSVESYACCRSCYKALARGVLPTTALANGLSFGDVPEALKGLSAVEQILISPLRCKMTVMMLSSVAGPGTAQRAIKSHAVAFPQDVQAIADQLLPLPLSALSEQLVVVLVKDKAPTPEQMRTLFICRRQKVHDALVWLLEHRQGTASAYANMQLSRQEVKLLPIGRLNREQPSGRLRWAPGRHLLVAW